MENVDDRDEGGSMTSEDPPRVHVSSSQDSTPMEQAVDDVLSSNGTDRGQRKAAIYKQMMYRRSESIKSLHSADLNTGT